MIRNKLGVRIREYNITSEWDCKEDLQPDNEYCAPQVQNILIHEVIPHPQYDATTYIADIGLLRLAAPIDLTVDSAKTICLPVANELRNRNYDNAMLTVTGWGAAEDGQKLDVLHKVYLPVVLKEFCYKAYEKTDVINGKQICAGGQNRVDSCDGDIGPIQTPFVYRADVRFVHFGVLSYGPRFCGRQEGFPTVYTRIDYYRDWILDNMEP